MPAVATERVGRRRQNGSGGSREYVITGATDEADARTALFVEAPTTLAGFDRNETESEVEEIDDGEGTFYGTAVWGTEGFDFQPPDSFELSFDIGTESVHITHSLATVNSYGSSPPDFKQAINVTLEGEVLGCDIAVPTLGYQFTLTVDEADMSNAYVQTLADVCGTVATGTFHGFAEGELLLVKVCGQRRSDGHWNLTFGYAVSRNRTGLTIGGITSIAKKGWDFLWVFFAVASDVGSGILTRIPRAVYVEQVYPRTDHNDIFP